MREPGFGAPEVARFRAFVTGWLGFELDDGKLWSLTDLLAARLRERRCDAETYLAGLESARPGSGELRALANELTVNETSFFRNAEQMAAFTEVALPESLAAARGRELRILSAGCASGEETYSLAMLVCTRTAGRDIVLTGIDADAMVLRKAAAGRYSAWSLRQTPPSYRTAFFRAERQEFVLSEAIRRMVRFEERNLLAADPAFWTPGAFDIVFCRNVLMYFTPQVARLVVARLAASLAPGGFLFLGLAESLRGLSDDFRLRQSHDTFYYQRLGGAPREAEEIPAAADADFVAIIDGSARRIRSLAARGRIPDDGDA